MRLRLYGKRGGLIPVIAAVGALTGAAAQLAADDFESKRRQMVRDQLASRDITDRRVLKVMGTVPRHLFVPANLARKAYSDHPLPIAEGQTISQPYIVALMTQLARVQPGERALEIGTGSGYQAAVLAGLTDEVFSIEIRPGLAASARKTLTDLGYENIRVKTADGYYGWSEHAPFDVILITAAANHIPPPLIRQLKPGGRMVLPLGRTHFFQTLTLVTKEMDGEVEVRHLMTVAFVPMIGAVQEEEAP